MSAEAPLPPPDARSGHGGAEIVAPGFQPYDGDRSGVVGAIRSVAWQSMRSALGIGRPARHKVFPVAAVGIAYVPATVFVGLAGARCAGAAPDWPTCTPQEFSLAAFAVEWTPTRRRTDPSAVEHPQPPAAAA